ncbi:UDP-3-O-(3-hydroxymyristoyl)glucosamine N-acyltransferase [bacterium]|nr:UDP-3-O-(3-hydroxymyristoyl)glucosamine N-acyltransferase [bacterium]
MSNILNMTLAQIARLIDGKVEGDPGMVISGISGIKEAKKGDITFLANARYCSLLKTTKASAIIIDKKADKNGRPVIRTDNPYIGFVKIMEYLQINKEMPLPGIHKTAVIGKNTKLGKNITIEAHVVLGNDVQIGDNTLIHANVSVRERVIIGSNVIIHNGAVIGSDGFGFTPIKGVFHKKVPQLGTVVVEDDVEIGANVTIDRATTGRTRIGKGTKIDNLVQIAHNVEIGEHCVIVAQVGISGSTTLGNKVTIAGQVGLAGHIKIGDNTIITAKSAATKDIGPNMCVSGYPAIPLKEEQKIKAYRHRLPEMHKTIQELSRKIRALEKKLG